MRKVKRKNEIGASRLMDPHAPKNKLNRGGFKMNLKKLNQPQAHSQELNRRELGGNL
jgi:hypothetical protein